MEVLLYWYCSDNEELIDLQKNKREDHMCMQVIFAHANYDINFAIVIIEYLH